MNQQHAPIHAQEMYSVSQWGNGYFSINDKGQLCVNPARTEQTLNLPDLVHNLREQGLRLPLLLRFVDILQDRIHSLYQAFSAGSVRWGYKGKYTAVYPIKVNQQATVVQEILRYPNAAVGLECGSKPELMAVLAMHNSPGKLIICNGYKDREYLRLALMGKQLGHQVLIIVEKLSELSLIMEEAKDLGVTPELGIRIRLSAIGKGQWQNTGGEKAKFGLSPTQLLQALEILKKNNMLECLCALHFHMGSQIANIQDIQIGLQECAHYYVELKRLGAPLQYIDVGGGLGVDYEGSASRSYFSLNYTMTEYAENVLHIFATVCEEANMPHPDIITEVGRAMTAHHAVLITEVIDVEQPLSDVIAVEPSEHASPLLHEMYTLYKQLGQHRLLESYHNIVYTWKEVQNRFNVGSVNLEERAHAEQIYVATCRQILKLLNSNLRGHREILDELKEKFATKYFANFSLFQSIPDAWALRQVFPVLPLDRLNEPLTEFGVLSDLTCDSDGCLKHYLHGQTTDTCMMLPAYQPNKEMLMGIFLVGAYQEILGDLHNLFGDTDAVNIRLSTKNGELNYQVEHIQPGNSVSDVLRYVNFDMDAVVHSYQRQVKQAGLTPSQQQRYLSELMAGLHGYTYLEE